MGCWVQMQLHQQSLAPPQTLSPPMRHSCCAGTHDMCRAAGQQSRVLQWPQLQGPEVRVQSWLVQRCGWGAGRPRPPHCR
jgi:hypothetical protein